ncbi:MAG: acetyl-CoA C-acyltransferase [Planctomycetes bacterium]|nr:acetyl-CoA C-acyltransferase [Planctomycetota bacterium]
MREQTKNAAYICGYARTPIGRYAGALARVRADDLAALPIRALKEKHPLDWDRLDDAVLGCANQAGEDNRNVARMALLLAGLPCTVPGVTVNRLCASGMEAVAMAARAVATGEANLIVAGGVESMSRAPLVMPKPTDAFSRNAEIHDSTLGWRFINPAMRAAWGVDSLADTAETLAAEFAITRDAQDRFAAWSQSKAIAAKQNASLAAEIVPVTTGGKGKDTAPVTEDEHPRATSVEQLAALKPITRPTGTVTAGNATGINDGAAALIIASEDAARAHALTPIARIVGAAAAGVEPGRMGIGPVPATQKLLARHAVTLDAIGVIELNEAFAAQALACLKGLNLPFDDERVNRWGGAIALGHPLGMSGARLIGTAARQLAASDHRLALCTMCVGVGQGVSVLLEKC